VRNEAKKKSGVRIVLFPFVACVSGRLRLRVVKREIGQKKAVSWTKKKRTQKKKASRRERATKPTQKQNKNGKQKNYSLGRQRDCVVTHVFTRRRGFCGKQRDGSSIGSQRES